MKIPSFLLEVLFCERFKVLYFSFTALNILYFLSVFLEIFLFLSLFYLPLDPNRMCSLFPSHSALIFYLRQNLIYCLWIFVLFYSSIFYFLLPLLAGGRRWASIFCAVFFLPPSWFHRQLNNREYTHSMGWLGKVSSSQRDISRSISHPKCCVSSTPQKCALSFVFSLRFVLVLLCIHWISPSVNKLSHCHRRWIFHLPLLKFNSSSSCMARGSERAKEKNQRLTTSNM